VTSTKPAAAAQAHTHVHPTRTFLAMVKRVS